MLKAVGRLFKSETSMWILVAIVVVVLAWALMSYSGNKSRVRDAMGSIGGGVQPSGGNSSLSTQSQNVAMPPPPAPPALKVPPPTSVNTRPTLQPADIVLNPVNTSDMLMSPQFSIGIDPIGNTLKNPSYDIRSEPPIPKQNVGPWNNSTYEPDLARVPFEIGAGER